MSEGGHRRWQEGIYYLRERMLKDEQIGPVTKIQLAELLLERKVQRDTKVFIGGRWTTCGELDLRAEVERLQARRQAEAADLKAKWQAAAEREETERRAAEEREQAVLRETVQQAEAHRRLAAAARQEQDEERQRAIAEQLARRKASTGADKFPHLVNYLDVLETLWRMFLGISLLLAVAGGIGLITLDAPIAGIGVTLGGCLGSIICYVAAMAGIDLVKVIIAIEVNRRPRTDVQAAVK